MPARGASSTCSAAHFADLLVGLIALFVFRLYDLQIRPGPRIFNDFQNKFIFLRWSVVSPTPKPQAGGPPLVVRPQLLIQCIRSYRLLVGKPNGKSPLERLRRKWVDNISMDLLELGWGDVNWIGLAQDRDRCRALVNSVLNLQVPYNAGKLSSVQTTSDLSSSA
jgi:hypothetical protein